MHALRATGLQALGLAALAGAVMALVPSISAAAVTHACGAPLRSLVKTDAAPFTTQSISFVNLPAAHAQITVPAGTSRCIKVTLSTESACFDNIAGTDRCFARISDDGALVLDPKVNGIEFVQENNFTAAHSFRWAARVGPGDYHLRAQVKVGAAGSTFSIESWTFDVEVTN